VAKSHFSSCGKTSIHISFVKNILSSLDARMIHMTFVC